MRFGRNLALLSSSDFCTLFWSCTASLVRFIFRYLLPCCYYITAAVTFLMPPVFALSVRPSVCLSFILLIVLLVELLQLLQLLCPHQRLCIHKITFSISTASHLTSSVWLPLYFNPLKDAIQPSHHEIVCEKSILCRIRHCFLEGNVKFDFISTSILCEEGGTEHTLERRRLVRPDNKDAPKECENENE